MTHLKVCIDKVFDIPNLASKNGAPFVRLKLGQDKGESHAGLSIPGSISDYDIYNHIVFENFNDNATLVTEVINGDTLEVLASASLHKWKSLLKDNRRHLILDLKPSGRIKMDLKISQGQDVFPNHLNILIGSASDLANVFETEKPLVVEVHVGETVWITGVGRRQPLDFISGYSKFEWNEQHIVDYHGERALEIFVREQAAAPINAKELTGSSMLGMCRYDLWDVCSCLMSNSHAPSKHVVGKICITDSRGTPIGALTIGLSLWDGRGGTKGQSVLEQYRRLRQEFVDTLQGLRERKNLDEDLLTRILKGVDSSGDSREGLSPDGSPSRSNSFKKSPVEQPLCPSAGGSRLSAGHVREVESQLGAAEGNLDQADGILADLDRASEASSTGGVSMESFMETRKKLKRAAKDTDKNLTSAERLLQILTYQAALAMVDTGRAARANIYAKARETKSAEDLLAAAPNQTAMDPELQKASEEVKRILAETEKQEEILVQGMVAIRSNQKETKDLLASLSKIAMARDELLKLLKEIDKWSRLFPRHVQEAKLEQRRADHILSKALASSNVDSLRLSGKGRRGLCPCCTGYYCCCCC